MSNTDNNDPREEGVLQDLDGNVLDSQPSPDSAPDSEQHTSDASNPAHDDGEVLEPASKGKGKGKRKWGGALAWMARNSVAANILMLIFLIGGAFKTCDIKQEVFPEFELDLILITVVYPGASPEEVEQGVILSIEEEVRGINGVKEVRSTANEGLAAVQVELLLGEDSDQVINEIKAAVDRIQSFPEEIERPTVFMARFTNQVISFAIYGDQRPEVLKAVAERARDALLQDKRVTVMTVTGLPPLEISIEISQENLRRYGLTIEQVAALVRASSVELPGGAVKTRKGEILLRTAERRDAGVEFGDIVVRSMPDGSKVYLTDIAEIKDGFAETDQVAKYGGKRAVLVNVFRVGEQTPIEVSAAVREYLEKSRADLPEGVEVAEWLDMSEWYEGRMDLLKKNAVIGLVLVLLVLGFFLEVKLAFWVTMGIPISFVGALLFLPSTGMSINMISLFAFIVVLGMVVDDAIIVGEAIYRIRQSGVGRVEAAIKGVKEVAVPVTFAIITSIVAFSPLLFVPGVMGKFFKLIPIVVITVLLMSLVESLIILPAHLAHSKKGSGRGIFGWIDRQQQRFSRFLEWQIQRFYLPTIRAAANRRYLTLAISWAVLIGTLGIVAGGRIPFVFFPAIAGDIVTVSIEMPFGTAIEQTQKVQDRVLNASYEILEENGGVDAITRGIYSNVGSNGLIRNDPGRPPQAGTHLSEIGVYLVPIDQRDMSMEEFVRKWRQRVGEIPGLERIRFEYSTGPGSGAPVNVVLSHPDLDVLKAAASELATEVDRFDGTFDINDGFESGKEQLDLKLKPEARALGLTELELARQIRGAFFGSEAVRQQRGREELRVYVRLPRDERESEYNIEELIIRTPQGGEIPLRQAADVERGNAFTAIRRTNGRRSAAVTADVDETINNATEINGTLTSTILPDLVEKYPGLRHQLGGDALQQAEAFLSLLWGFVMAIGAMFALLAIVFRSYAQPLIVLLAIPFGMVGAVFGHLAMGYALSFMSMMGIVALAGIVVNDSLIMIVSINRFREQGMPFMEAVVQGSVIRFRPIILTSLTTFFGLAPMIFETSVQARFLIPMAISLGFGVLLATLITLLIVPAAYVAMNDLKRFWEWTWANGSSGRP